MGRSRAVSHLSEEDPNQRSKRKRPTTVTTTTTSNTSNAASASNAETTETTTLTGKLALYHCNYCNKDISGKIRIKCVVCPDFDLCIECFSVGAEVTPHKSNHPYRVMDNLAFPLLCSDWNVDEEMLLLEGIEMYGFGNWTEVSEHVGTKRRSQCIDHYNAVYMNSPCFPLPDMSHVMGKSREELLAMSRGHGEVKKEIPNVGELTLKEESSFSARVRSDESKEGPAWQSSSSLTSETGKGLGSSSGNTFSSVIKKASNNSQIKDGIKMEEFQSDRSIGEKKPRVPGDEGPSMTELSGYNFKRQEFEIEYDNDAEQILADMEFKNTDSAADRELKLRVLRIYSKRLDERKRRKDFILERNLLYPDPLEKSLLPKEREICQRYKVFMRFHSKEEHDELLKNIIEEQQIVKRIQDLQEARAAGCRTAAEANRFLEQKRKMEAEETEHGIKVSAQGPSGKVLQRPTQLKGEFDASPRGVVKGSTGLELSGKDSSLVMQAISSDLDKWDITGFVGADLLSETNAVIPNFNLMNQLSLDKILKTMVFVHTNGQLRAAHLILDYIPIFKSFQTSRCVIKARDPHLHRINVAALGFLTIGPISEGTLTTDPIPKGIPKVALPFQRATEEEATSSQPATKEEEEEGDKEVVETVTQKTPHFLKR